MKTTSVCACCFTEHRDIPPPDIPRLCQRLRDGIRYFCSRGVTGFYTRGAFGLNMLAAEAVQRYMQILKQADHAICLSECYT